MNLTANTAGFARGLNTARGQMTGFAGQVKAQVESLKGSFASLATGVLAALGARAAITAAQTQIAAERKLEAVLKATGHAAGFTAAEIKQMAADLQQVTNFGDEATISAAAMLATFKEIKGDTFREALVAAQDMSAVMGQDLKPSIVQLGKALNDPIRGVAALREVGVSFTQQQQDQIKALVKSGQMMKAQQIILAELKSEFGGAAQAMRDPLVQLGNEIGDVAEKIGVVLLKAIEFFRAGLQPIVNLVTNLANQFRENLGPVVMWLSGVFGDSTGVLKFLGTVLVGLIAIWVAYKVAVVAVAAATIVLKALQGPAGWAAIAAAVGVAAVAMSEFGKQIEGAGAAAKRTGDELARIKPVQNEFDNPLERSKGVRRIGSAEFIVPPATMKEAAASAESNAQAWKQYVAQVQEGRKRLAEVNHQLALLRAASPLEKFNVETAQFRRELEAAGLRLKDMNEILAKRRELFDAEQAKRVADLTEQTVKGLERQIAVLQFGEEVVKRWELSAEGVAKTDLDRIGVLQRQLSVVQEQKRAYDAMVERAKSLRESLKTPGQVLRDTSADLFRMFRAGQLSPEQLRRGLTQAGTDFEEDRIRRLQEQRDNRPQRGSSGLLADTQEAFDAVFNAVTGNTQTKLEVNTEKIAAHAAKLVALAEEERRRNLSRNPIRKVVDQSLGS